MRKSLIATTAAIAMGATAITAPVANAAEVTLKLVTMLPLSTPIGRTFDGFMKRLNAEMKGEFQIDHRGGPEVIGQFKQPNAVRLGSVDMTLTSPSYANGILNVSGTANYSNKQYAEIKATGYHDYMTELHKAKGLVYIGELPVSQLRFHIFLKEPITKLEDFKGMKIRVFPAIRPAMAALGANPVVLPMPAIYTSMERGVVQGFVTGVSGVAEQYKGVVGAYVERIKFSAVILFSGLWLIFVYAPSTHWIWGGGILADLGWISESLKGVAVMDFAGGLVVHANAGVAALILAAALGPRRGFPSELRPPHNPGLVMIGAAMLWVGWFGFNGGSALAADGAAGMAITVTHISAATACLTWVAIEWIKFGKPSLVGIATGAIAGLATITPGSGFVGPVGGLVFGFLAGIICFYAINMVKSMWKIDDSLDVFAVHGVGGVLGILLTSVFAAPQFGGLGGDGYSIGTAFMGQLIGTVITVIWAGVAGYIILKIVQATVGLRTTPEEETEGLDITAHGERSYDL